VNKLCEIDCRYFLHVLWLHVKDRPARDNTG